MFLTFDSLTFKLLRALVKEKNISNDSETPKIVKNSLVWLLMFVSRCCVLLFQSFLNVNENLSHVFRKIY